MKKMCNFYYIPFFILFVPVLVFVAFHTKFDMKSIAFTVAAFVPVFVLFHLNVGIMKMFVNERVHLSDEERSNPSKDFWEKEMHKIKDSNEY